MITSVRNPKVQEVRALQQRAKKRRVAGGFVVEGVRLVEEALNAGWLVRQVFFTEDLSDRGRQIVAELRGRGVPAETVSETVMEAMSDTETPQGLLIELEWQQLSLPKQLDLVLVLDGFSDPGNMGSMLRSAAAAGCGAVLLAPGCSDSFSPKVLRGGMGAQFRLAIQNLDWPAVASFCQQHDLSILAAEARQGQAYDRVDLTRPLAFLIGGEAHGISDSGKKLDPTPLQIPISGEIESLNAAVAGSILLFEALRQRRGNQP